MDPEAEELLRKFGKTQCYIYCSGKAGSSTLLHTLTQYYPTTHLHMNGYWRKEIIRSTKITIYDCIDISATKYPFVYLIDSYRLPVERRMASFFQNLHRYVTPEELSLDEPELLPLLSQRLDKWNSIENYHSINEVMKHYQIPFFDYFDFDNQFNMKISGNLVFIKVRFADIANWNQILEKIFGHPVTMISSNLASEKPYASLYSKFKEYYRIMRSDFSEMMNGREFLIYTTDEEKEMYYNLWKDKLRD
jgi:hypothetical protein